VNTASNRRRWEYDLTLKSVQGLRELKSKIIKAVLAVPGVLPKPTPEALLINVDVPNSDAAKLRVLWWTDAPRQHQMLGSYDQVLTAIAQAVKRPGFREPTAA
jgi:hypothetical protein